MSWKAIKTFYQIIIRWSYSIQVFNNIYSKEQNKVFSSAVKKYQYFNDSLSKNTDHPTFKAIVMLRIHPSILALESEHKNMNKLFFILFLKKLFSNK